MRKPEQFTKLSVLAAVLSKIQLLRIHSAGLTAREAAAMRTFDMATAATLPADPETLITDMARCAREARRVLATMPSAAKEAALMQAAAALREDAEAILAANGQDMAAGEARGLTSAMLDRLYLDSARLGDIASAVEAVGAIA